MSKYFSNIDNNYKPGNPGNFQQYNANNLYDLNRFNAYNLKNDNKNVLNNIKGYDAQGNIISKDTINITDSRFYENPTKKSQDYRLQKDFGNLYSNNMQPTGSRGEYTSRKKILVQNDRQFSELSHPSQPRPPSRSYQSRLDNQKPQENCYSWQFQNQETLSNQGLENHQNPYTYHNPYMVHGNNKIEEMKKLKNNNMIPSKYPPIQPNFDTETQNNAFNSPSTLQSFNNNFANGII